MHRRSRSSPSVPLASLLDNTLRIVDCDQRSEHSFYSGSEWTSAGLCGEAADLKEVGGRRINELSAFNSRHKKHAWRRHREEVFRKFLAKSRSRLGLRSMTEDEHKELSHASKAVREYVKRKAAIQRKFDKILIQRDKFVSAAAVKMNPFGSKSRHAAAASRATAAVVTPPTAAWEQDGSSSLLLNLPSDCLARVTEAMATDDLANLAGTCRGCWTASSDLLRHERAMRDLLAKELMELMGTYEGAEGDGRTGWASD